MKKGIFASLLLAAVAVVGTAQTSQALPLFDSFTGTLFSRIGDNQTDAQDRTSSPDDSVTEQNSELEAKRSEIERKLIERRAAIAKKLSGKRVALCEKKESTINRVLDDRVSDAERHFEKFKAIQDKLVTFVAEKQIDVQNANALLIIMNDRQQDAEAAIDAVANVDFDCSDADAEAPGAIVKDEVTALKQALKDYRTAIKNYAVGIKNSATTQTDDSADHSETESQESAQ